MFADGSEAQLRPSVFIMMWAVAIIVSGAIIIITIFTRPKIMNKLREKQLQQRKEEEKAQKIYNAISKLQSMEDKRSQVGVAEHLLVTVVAPMPRTIKTLYPQFPISNVPPSNSSMSKHLNHLRQPSVASTRSRKGDYDDHSVIAPLSKATEGAPVPYAGVNDPTYEMFGGYASPFAPQPSIQQTPTAAAPNPSQKISMVYAAIKPKNERNPSS